METTLTFDTIEVERRGAGAWLFLNRPQVMNAFNPQMIEDLDAALGEIEAEDDVRAVVVSGRGRAFCAGGDFDYVKTAATGKPHDARSRFLERLMVVLDRLEQFPKPVIAAINGVTLAGGLEIVLCCDIVIAAESARIGDAHATYGFVPGGGASVRLPRKIGPNRAKLLFFTGDHLPAAELVAPGLVNQVVPDVQLADAVAELIAKIAAKSPLGLRRIKRLVNDGLDQPVATALRLEHMMGDLHWTSDDMKEGVDAFIEKRAPQFKGR
jgi:enoyl-CoA hydratase/carnithine racemase